MTHTKPQLLTFWNHRVHLIVKGGFAWIENTLYNLLYRVNSIQANQLLLTVTRPFQEVKELRFDMCHEKAKCALRSSARRLFSRLERAMTINVIFQIFKSSQVKLILSPKQRAKPAASRTRTCTNAAVCIASGECPSRFWHRTENESVSGHAKMPPASHQVCDVTQTSDPANPPPCACRTRLRDVCSTRPSRTVETEPLHPHVSIVDLAKWAPRITKIWICEM